MFILRLSRVTKVNCMTDGRVWQRVIHQEKTRKKLTFGAKGFVLKSAMTDDGGAMRVCSRRKAWAEGVVSSRACQSIWNQSLTGHRTPPLTMRGHHLPGSFHLPSCVSRDSNLSIMAHFLLWLSSIFLFFQLALSHLIEIPASKKECFFEDLHVNDQVRNFALPRCQTRLTCYCFR